MNCERFNKLMMNGVSMVENGSSDTSVSEFFSSNGIRMSTRTLEIFVEKVSNGKAKSSGDK